MTAVDTIRRVEAHGGTLLVKNGDLIVRAQKELPGDLVTELRDQKAAIMVALAEPHGVTVASVLREIRPRMNPVLQQLSDERLLILINWNIIAAWEATLQGVNR